MIIAQVSDTHLALDTADAAQRIADFERTIADINTLDPLPDVIIHTGDIVQNGRADEYHRAAEILSAAVPPTFVMVGNKDDRQGVQSILGPKGFLPPTDQYIAYLIDHFPVRLVILDTLNPGSNKGDFCAERTAHLHQLLEKPRSAPMIVFAHHPPFIVSVGPDPLHFETIEIMHRFRASLGQLDGLIGVVCGHVHRGTMGWLTDVPISVMPSVATSLRRGDYPRPLQTRPIYHIHRYDPAWGFSTEARIA